MTDQSAIKLLIAQSHPVQYHAPVYRELGQIRPNSIHVVYACHFTAHAAVDPGFGTALRWDEDLLAGYPCTVLDPLRTQHPKGWNALSGNGIGGMIDHIKPAALLLTSLNYRFDLAAYYAAIRRGIPVWIRCETQDYAFQRSWVKSVLRSAYYRTIYSRLSKVFCIGELNRQHWLSHGIKPYQLRDALYCTPNRVTALTPVSRDQARSKIRGQLGIPETTHLIAFFGKLIDKKNPALILDSIKSLSQSHRSRLAVLFVGAGELLAQLKRQAAHVLKVYAVQSFFPGFINQLELVEWYLASDTVILPSHSMGETWGLVVNEAMQAGCNAIVSDAVGCSRDFGNWPRVRVISPESAPSIAFALQELMDLPANRFWADHLLQPYSTQAVAHSLAAEIDELP